MLPEGLIRATIAKRRGVRVEDVRDAVEGGDEEAAAARAIADWRERTRRVSRWGRRRRSPPRSIRGVRERAGMRADRAGWEYRRAQRELLEELERAAKRRAEARRGHGMENARAS